MSSLLYEAHNHNSPPPFTQNPAPPQLMMTTGDVEEPTTDKYCATHYYGQHPLYSDSTQSLIIIIAASSSYSRSWRTRFHNIYSFKMMWDCAPLRMCFFSFVLNIYHRFLCPPPSPQLVASPLEK